MSRQESPIISDTTGQNIVTQQTAIATQLTAMVTKLQGIIDGLTPVASQIGVTTTGMHVITEDEVQGALTEVDTALYNLNSNLAQKKDTSVSGLICVKNLNVCSVYLITNSISFNTDNKTLNQVVPTGYRPKRLIDKIAKIYNGSSYVECRVRLNTNGTMVISDFFNNAITNANLGFLQFSEFTFVIDE